MNHPTTPVWLQWSFFGVLSVFLLLGLSVDRVAGACFYLLILLGLASILQGGRASLVAYAGSWRRYWPLYLAMTSVLLSLALNQWFFHQFSSNELNFGLRFFGFVFFFWGICQLEKRFFHWMGWLFAGGAVIVMLKTYWLTGGGVTRDHPNFMPILAFSELGGLLGVMAVLSIAWSQRSEDQRYRLRRCHLPLVLAGVCSLYTIYLYQSRGAWLAIPVFAIAISLTFLPGKTAVRKMLVALVALLLIGVIYGTTSSVQQRVAQIQADVHDMKVHDKSDSSIGTRMQLWKASARIFAEHPLIGVGLTGYSPALKEMARRGLLSEQSSQFPHSHNEALFFAVILGSAGIVSLLALYVVPLIYFLRAVTRAPQTGAAAAMMGVTLVLSYVAYGLVDVMLLWRECALFYVIVLAVLMGAVERMSLNGNARCALSSGINTASTSAAKKC
jgi:O-antigen ligase